MYNLFLDDLREINHVTWIDLPLVDWTIVRSYSDFVKTIDKRGIPKIITYDIDLDDTHYKSYFNKSYLKDWPHFKVKCGIDCAMYLIDKCNESGVKHPEHYIHSMNLVGKQYVAHLIEFYNKKFEESV